MLETRRKKVLLVIGFVSFITYINTGVIRDELVFNVLKNKADFLTEVNENTNFFNMTLEGRGVLLYTKGGIGNQLFVYACSYALAKQRNSQLFTYVVRKDNETELSSVRKFLPHQREFALDKFQIPMDNLIDQTTAINSTLVAAVNDDQLLHGNYSAKPFLKLSGASYCQSETYWDEYKDEIASMFQLKPEVIREFPQYVTMLEKEIDSTEESVAIHVRRGDFTKVTGYFVPISYQRSGIRRIIKILNERRGNVSSKATPKFFVFSDDIDYTREKFQDFAAQYKFVFVSSPNGTGNRTTSIQDFHLMTKCKHFIIPNSTFAWWATYLSMKWGRESSPSERVVIASAFNPKYWRLWGNDRDKKFNRMLYGQIYHPKEWIIIDPFVGQK